MCTLDKNFVTENERISFIAKHGGCFSGLGGSSYLNDFYCGFDFLRLYEEMPNKCNETKDKVVVSEVWKHLIAGASAGAVSRTCTAPLDRLKITLQVQASQKKSITLKGTIRCLLKEGGISSFWRGNGISVLKIMPELALRFSVYNEVKSFIKSNKSVEELEIYDRFLAGSIAGAVSQTLVFPLEVIKTRLVLRKTGESSWSCIQDMFCRKRYRGLYRGYVPSLFGVVMYAGIDLTVYETLKKEYLLRMSSGDKPPVIVQLMCGICGSVCGQVVSYPMSLVKTRFQAESASVPSNHSLISTFKNILVRDGVSGLYRGLSANLLKVAPAVGITYVVYEQTRSYLGASMS